MSKDKKANPQSVENANWGEMPQDNFGYSDLKEKRDRRGLEDWEMLQEMESSNVHIPYWFIAVFIVLLIVAVGLTFPFWGNRPGFERPWFDWGIPAGVAWVVIMSFIIYYFVDLRHVLREKREAKEKQASNSDKDVSKTK
ncbi:MAG: hypothetical protein OEX00_11495 [Gammaproteobacteria bacterium]|nr:hypothetical protein [Gammaproteobacteria bacterium]MDH5694212.1 hypothetical protein [Gammaproteobacteria bacterium]